MAQELTQDQYNDLVSRHPIDVPTIMDQLLTMPTDRAEQGIAYADSVYGTVLFSLDASDHLHVVGNAPGTEEAYNAQTYTPPPFSCEHELLGICFDPLFSLLGLALIGGFLFVMKK